MNTKPTKNLKQVVTSLAALLATLASPSAFAASQTWSNAPANNYWSNAVNWAGNAIPGAVNSSTTADIATFDSPISLPGYGGAGQPITNDLQRSIRSVRFDTAACGAYVFGTDLNDNSLEITHLGDISINPTVTKPIIFNEGLRFRIPNSTNGRYDVTNNAVNPNATMFINVISNTSASTRPLTMFLGGENPGTNTIVRFDDNGGANGAIQLDKVGGGTWILSGPNDMPQKTSAGNIARVQVIEGTLIVKDVASLGAISPANLLITNTGVLQIDNISPQNLGFSLRNGGTLRMNGSGAVNGIIVGNQAAVSATLATTSFSDVFMIGSAGVVSGGAVDTVVHTAGSGTVQLATGNTYVGNWSLEAATNQLINYALANSRNVNLSAGAMLDVSVFGGLYTLGSVSFSANGTGTAVGLNAATINAGPGGTFDFGSKVITLTFTPTSASGDTTHPALYVSSGAVSLNANQFTVNNSSGSPLSAGTYRLIEQASGTVAVTGTPFAIVTGAGLAVGHVADVQVTGGFVNLVVSPHTVANLTWQGGNPNSDWDNLTTANWFNGVGLVTFGNSDAVTFDSTGSANPNINLAATVLPSTVKVDTAANDYSFSGVGQIAGTASLTKVGANALMVQTANSYQGGTTISNGTLRVGIENAIPSTGVGNVSLYSPGVIDLNNFSNLVNGLIGNGTVDNQAGGDATIAVGNNNSSSTFSGALKNTSGTLGLTKVGSGTLTLTTAQTYSGLTTVNGGTLRVDNYNGLGSGVTNVAVNAGTLNVSTNVIIGGLNGAGGTVANNVNNLPTMLTLQGTGDYSGVIANGTGGGGVGLYVKSGTTRLSGISTYTNGTVVASGATLAVGVINALITSGQAGTGGIIASNGAAFSLPTSLSTASALGNTITNIDASGTLFFSSIGQANNFSGQFVGGASNTNVFSGPMSIGGVTSFSNFLGTVVISNGASVRFFNANGGGDNTIFDVRGGVFSRDAITVRLGALIGVEGGLYAPSVTPPATFLIGAKGLSTTFSGTIQGSNNIVKVGSGSLVLNGIAYYTNTVTLPDTSVVDYTVFSNKVAYLSATTVSNGLLKVVAPNNLTNSVSITLAGTSAVLDATTIGYATNQTTLDINSVDQPTNSVVVISGTVEILAGQTIGGFGTIQGNVTADIGSTVSPGLPTGTLNITGTATVNGTISIGLNRTNLAANSGRLAAGVFAINGAILNVTNVGPTLVSGTTFQLFSTGVTGFGAVNLPATDVTGLIPYVWQDNLALNGSITLTTGLNTNPTTLISVVVGTTLDLAWPVDHLGWTLQNQTNGINVGLSTNWFTVAGSTATNHVVVPIVRTNPAVFYRLNLPLP